MASGMPTFVTVFIYDSSCSRTLLEWTILDVGDERMNVESFYKVALSLCSESSQQHLTELKHCIEEAKIGKTRESMMRIGNRGRHKNSWRILQRGRHKSSWVAAVY